jgi:glycosyltransferase involved in cell wall biosynthesis
MEVGGRVAGVDLSVVMPCLNEEVSIAWCVQRAWRGIERAGLRGEVVVCDNGSVDRSVELARGAGARVVVEGRRGYGRAYLTGIEASVGRIVVIGDSDYSYDFFELHRLVGPLFEGYDYVLGSRFAGRILPGAMPFLNRYLGNPVLTGLLNRLFGLRTSDAHSGMRAFTRDAFERMGLQCEGMEFASEIVIAAARARLRVTEVPITYHPRLGHSKLRRWRDGARHVRFMVAEALRPRTRHTTTTPEHVTASSERRDELLVGGPGGSSRTNGSLPPTSEIAPSGAVAAGSSDTDAEGDPERPQPEPSTETAEP